MVSFQDLWLALEQRLQSSTRRSEVMNAGTQIYVRRYVGSFLSEIADKGITSSLQFRNAARAWLHSQPLVRSTKQLAAITLAHFLCEEGAMTEGDKKTLLGWFRAESSDWGEKALAPDELERVLFHLASSSGRGLTPSRDLYVTVLMTIFGMRISSVLGLGCADVRISADGKTMEYRIENKKGGFGKAKHSLKSCEAGLVLPGCPPLIQIHEEYVHFRGRATREEAGRATSDELWAVSEDSKENPKPKAQSPKLPSSSFFINRSRSEVSDDYYRGFYAALGKEFGIKLHPHRFRHTAGTMITAAAGIAQAATILGHARVTTTQRYIRQSGFDQPAILSQVFGVR